MRKLLSLAAMTVALFGAGCASRVVVDPQPVAYAPVVVAPAPVVVARAPAVVIGPRRVAIPPVCGLRSVRVVGPGGRVVFRRQRVC